MVLEATLNGIVSPAKAGFRVYIQREISPDTWVDYDNKYTDANGRVTFIVDAPAWGETPWTYRLNILAGQVIDGVEYTGDISDFTAQVWDGSDVDLYLYVYEVEPDPFETVYHSTYRGFEIRQYTLSKWYTFTTDMVWVKETLQECYDEIDKYLYEPPEPEPYYWKLHSYYRGIGIWVWMPYRTPYTAYFGGAWHERSTLSSIKAAIDAFLGPEIQDARVTGIVTPAKAGFRVFPQRLREGVWVGFLTGEYTDPAGTVSWLMHPEFSPVRLRMLAQTVDGVEYKAYTSEQATIWAGSEVDLYLYPEALPLLPSSATVTVNGRATGGYPTPSMRLYVYDKGVQVGYKDFPPISIGSWYTYEKVITGAGVHTVYGRMVLTNPLGSYEFTTETIEFELG